MDHSPRTRPGLLRTRSPLRRGTALLAAAAAALAIPLAIAPARAASGPDGPISVDTPYQKANHATPSPGDAILDCGQNRRQQNEPTAAIDPGDTSVITSGSNDYCTVDKAGGTWAG